MEKQLKFSFLSICSKLKNFTFLTRKHNLLLFGGSIAIIIMQSCFSVKYSTSGASIPIEMKTFSIAYIPNRSNDALATPFSSAITEKLREKIRQNTSLKEVVDGGDAMFEGEISGYTTQPVSIQSGDVAAKNRLTVTVKVKFINSINTELNFDTQFSRYEDYDSQQSADWAAINLREKIIDNITEDIFNKAFVNW